MAGRPTLGSRELSLCVVPRGHTAGSTACAGHEPSCPAVDSGDQAGWAFWHPEGKRQKRPSQPRISSRETEDSRYRRELAPGSDLNSEQSSHDSTVTGKQCPHETPTRPG